MGSKIALKNAQDQEFSINHLDNAGAISINSSDIATTAYVDGKMVLMTSVNTTSGTAFDFTGIPSWVKRITIIFNGVSTNGNSAKLVQLGSTSIQTTGYLSGHGYGGANSGGFNTTSGFGIGAITTTDIFSGHMIITKISGNLYISSNSGGFSSSANTLSGGGSVSLSGVLDRIRITAVNGTDTFDAGSINIMYEG